MKKTIFFFVSANIKFEKNYVNIKHNRDENDSCKLLLNEIFGIEKRTSSSDEEFYLNLKKLLTEGVQQWMDSWVNEKNEEIPKDTNWKWVRSHGEILNISRIS